MSDLIDRQGTKSIPYEECRLVFDRVMHTLDGKTLPIGLPIQCNMCVLSSDKRLIAMEIDKLFEKMHEAVYSDVMESKLLELPPAPVRWLDLIDDLVKEFANNGGDSYFIVDGQEYRTDTGYAMEGIELFAEKLKERIENG